MSWGTPSKVERSLEEMIPPDLQTTRFRHWIVTYPEVGVIARVTICDVDESPEIVGLAVEQMEVESERPRIISAELLRGAPLRQLKRACLSDGLDPARHFLSVAGEPETRGRNPITRELLQRVSETYRTAKELGLPTRSEIARVEHVGIKTAEKYVRLARDERLLEESPKGRKPS